MTDLDKLFNDRHTTRVFYDDDHISNDHIDLIIESAKKAPSKNCIFPYRIDAWTNSIEGKAAKQHMYRNVCTTQWQMGHDEMLFYDINRQNIHTPRIHMTQCLRQIKAPLTLAFIGEWVDDQNKTNLFWDTKDNFDKFNLKSVMQTGDIEVVARVIRDVMLACSWAQLKAQELGYETSFIGIAGQHQNDLVNQCNHIKIKDNETCLVLLCIGNENFEDTSSQPNCVLEELNVLDDNVTEAVFYERRRIGQHEMRGSPVPGVNKI